MIQAVVNGLMLSSFYCAIAVGFTLVCGVVRLVNYAHGELFMLGAFLFWLFSLAGVPFIISLVIVVVAISLLGIGIDQILIRRIRGDFFAGIMVTIGLMLSLQVAALQIFGTVDKIAPPLFSGVVKILGASVPTQRLGIIFIALALMGGLWLFLQKTRQGRALRACMQDSDAAALQGVNLNTTASIAMGIAAALAGVAGLLMAPTINVNPWIGGRALWVSFVVVIVGGMGSINGALIAAFFFGFMDSIIVTYVAPYFMILVDAIVMLLVLVIRPKGILGRAIEI